MWQFQGNVALCLITSHTINTFIEPSLKQTQRPQKGLTDTVADGEFLW
jgi:hypothetical protein